MILGETLVIGVLPKSVMPEDDSPQDLKVYGLPLVKKDAAIWPLDARFSMRLSYKQRGLF